MQWFTRALSFSVVFVALAAPARAQTIATSAPFAILVDAESGSVLFEKNADDPMSPASMVKVMTAEIAFKALKDGSLNPEDTMTISENAWRRGGAPSGGSTMFAQLNSRVRVIDLLRGAIIQSGNDASIALAEGMRGTEEAFAAAMNMRARELGMTRTTFRNSWGAFHPEQKTTSRDLATLSVHVVRNYPDLYKIYGETEFTWNKIRQLNRNPLLTMNIGADGLKTGNIEDSGFGLIGSAVEGGTRLVVVVNGLKTGRERAEEARKLLVWGLRAFDHRALFAKGEVVGAARVFGGAVGSVPLVSDTPVRVMSPRGSNERLVGRIVWQGPIVAPVKEGDQIARLKVFRGKTLALDIPLRAAQDVEPGALHQRALDAGVEWFGGLFRRYVFKS
ncbi:MAG: D-alanyl-D-alanine carboxypeptidase family protein [Beijerinckiaceae bacterium]|nr:D-alanyl-D-alanine carboxypeptidase family protein [Beijerinckiaceae bacterium]